MPLTDKTNNLNHVIVSIHNLENKIAMKLDILWVIHCHSRDMFMM